MTKEAVCQYIEQRRRLKFTWGRLDCHTFTVDILNILYPNNRLPQLRESYADRLGALKLAQKYSWVDELDKAFDIKILDNKKAVLQDFDIIIIPYNGFEGMHVVLDNKIWSVQENSFIIDVHQNLYKHFKNTQIVRIEGVKA